jgi:diguanylate cyclase (GGDEF)-like protein/PAS domain S-box-containing protein
MSEKDFFKSLLDNLIYDGVYFVDRNKRITYWNKGAEILTGYDDDSIVGKCYNDSFLAVKNGDEDHDMILERTLESGKSVTHETYISTIDGKNVPVFIKITPVKDIDGNIMGAVEVFNDNSSKIEIIRENDELRKMALYDSLTDIPNRRYFEMRFKSKLDEFQRYKWNFGFIFIDIDRFKSFNDSYGHEVGDRVLKIFAKNVSNTLRPFDVFCRWGGEEFTAIVVNVNKSRLNKITMRIKKIVENISINVNDTETTGITVSMGATLVKKSDTIETVFQRADRLLYESKNSGRNRISIG